MIEWNGEKENTRGNQIIQKKESNFWGFNLDREKKTVGTNTRIISGSYSCAN